MEGLGFGSGGELWPCLAANTCENTDRSVLRLAKAFRETRPDAFVFMRGVCLSAAFSRSELLDFYRLPYATIGSLPASWRDGQPTRLLLEASARWPRVCEGCGVPCRIGLKQRDRAQARRTFCVCRNANLLQKRWTHLHSEPLWRLIVDDLRRLTFDISGLP